MVQHPQVNQCDTPCQQNERQKLYDHLNRDKKRDLTEFNIRL